MSPWLILLLALLGGGLALAAVLYWTDRRRDLVRRPVEKQVGYGARKTLLIYQPSNRGKNHAIAWALGGDRKRPSEAKRAGSATDPHLKVQLSNGIVVEGLDNCLVKFARCCSPVPGDDIVGFITRGYGVSVHRTDCPNASPAKQKAEPGRWIRVSWGESEQTSYKAYLEVSAKDRDGLALDVATALSAAKVRVESFSAKGMPDGFAMVSIALFVKDKDELAAVTTKLNNISGVMAVSRAAG